MKLIWHGHSCFTLETKAGVLALDPYRDDVVPGLSPLRLTADAVYCSHQHRDHVARELVELTGRPHGVEVEEIPTFHDDTEGSQRGENLIRIFTAEGLRVAHLGDLGCEPDAAQLARLKNLDALLIPVGGYYTIDAQQANTLARALNPRVVVPMHYRGADFGYDVIGPVEDFTALRGDVVVYPGNALMLDENTPAQTAVLTYGR